MNLGTMRDQTSRFVGDPQVTRYAAADYLNALNLAQNQFALETRALWKDVTWTAFSGTAAYAFSAASSDASSNFMLEDWVTYDGKELVPISRHKLQLLKPDDDWTDDAGTPTHFLIDPEEAVKKIRLYPIPQDAKTISMRYFPLPTALASDSDTPLNSSALMSQFHIGLCAYAAWLLLATEETTQFVSEKRRELLSIYADSRDKAIETFKNTVSTTWRMRGNRVYG